MVPPNWTNLLSQREVGSPEQVLTEVVLVGPRCHLLSACALESASPPTSTDPQTDSVQGEAQQGNPPRITLGEMEINSYQPAEDRQHEKGR